MTIFKGWRTIAVNIGLALPILWDVVVQLAAVPEVQRIVPPEWRDAYLLAAALVNIGLRVITTTPVGRRE